MLLFDISFFPGLIIICSLIYQRAGAVFPQRSESSVPIYTPPQTQPLQNYPPPALRNTNYRQEAPESSSASEIPTLRYIAF
jgi:hypothetical protein